MAFSILLLLVGLVCTWSTMELIIFFSYPYNQLNASTTKEIKLFPKDNTHRIISLRVPSVEMTNVRGPV